MIDERNEETFSIGEIVKVKGQHVFKATYPDNTSNGSITLINKDQYYYGEVVKKNITIMSSKDGLKERHTYEIRVKYTDIAEVDLSVESGDIESTSRLEKFKYLNQYVDEDKVIVYNLKTCTFVKVWKNGGLEIKQFDTITEALEYTKVFGKKDKLFSINSPYLLVYNKEGEDYKL